MASDSIEPGEEYWTNSKMSVQWPWGIRNLVEFHFPRMLGRSFIAMDLLSCPLCLIQFLFAMMAHEWTSKARPGIVWRCGEQGLRKGQQTHWLSDYVNHRPLTLDVLLTVTITTNHGTIWFDWTRNVSDLIFVIQLVNKLVCTVADIHRRCRKQDWITCHHHVM